MNGYSSGKASKSQRNGRSGSFGSASGGAVGNVLLGALYKLGEILKAAFVGLGHLIVALWNKTKVGAICAFLVLAGLIGFGIDNLLTADKIYQGVSIGGVNVSGMTIEEAQNSINDEFSQRLLSSTVYIFPNDQSLKEAGNLSSLSNEGDKDYSIDESAAEKGYWTATAINLGAELLPEPFAEQAFSVGRNFNLFQRVDAAINGVNIPLSAKYNDIKYNNLKRSIESSIGDPAVEFGIEVIDGNASVTEGHDGYNIDDDVFKGKLNDAFLYSPSDVSGFTAEVIYTPVKIDNINATETCDAVNSAITTGASFTYNGQNLGIDRQTLGSWITTEVHEVSGHYLLYPMINIDAATSSLISMTDTSQLTFDVNIEYEEDGSTFKVIPDAPVVIPSFKESLTKLDDTLFSSYRKTREQAIEGTPFDIEVTNIEYSGDFSLDEALAYGIVKDFSSYTTTYMDTIASQNRVYNIHLAADLLNNSVAKANGGRWSFNDVAGNCDLEAGFKEAGVTVGDEVIDGVGGGVCQVATTVFNAVYNSGLKIIERYNHTLHIRTYPDGRDAAIAQPIMDLVWENNSPSDVLVRLTYTNTSVTASMIGVSPGYQVETETGEWKEGEDYVIRIEESEWVEEGKYTVEQAGENGSEIYVIRTVKDQEGNVIDERTFVSVYDPRAQVVLVGPGTDKDYIMEIFENKRQQQKREKESSSSSSSSNSSKSNNSSSSSSSNSSKSSSSSTSSSTSTRSA